MICYRFPDRDTFRALAATEGLLTEDGQLVLCSHTHAIDEIGIISRGGQWDRETGETITPPEVVDGWHVNTEGIAPLAWDSYLIVVNHPSRVFAGGAMQAPDTTVLETIAGL